MRRLLDKASGLLLDSLFSLFWPAVGLGLVALVLGRSAPGLDLNRDAMAKDGRESRTPAPPRYVGIDGAWSELRTSAPLLLDRETGNVMPCPAPGGLGLTQLNCSPWRDHEGCYHLVGQCTGGLARFTYPGGRTMRRIMTDVIPDGNVCWAPDRSERVLFASLEHRLYLLDLPAADPDRSEETSRSRLVRWRIDPPEGEVLLQEDPCWPSIPALGGWLLATIGYRNSPVDPSSKTRIWWLLLNSDEAAIVAAEPAIKVDETAPSPPMGLQRLPGVGVARDGTPVLAYLARDHEDREWDLWLAPIAPAVAGSCPRVLVPAARRLARGCSRVLAPTFSADGRWIYAALAAGERFHLDRFAVTIGE